MNLKIDGQLIEAQPEESLLALVRQLNLEGKNLSDARRIPRGSVLP